MCTAIDGHSGATVTSYQWYKNGVALANGENVSGTTQSTLSVSSVTLLDQGTYQCSATNVDGYNSTLSSGVQVIITGMQNQTANSSY